MTLSRGSHIDAARGAFERRARRIREKLSGMRRCVLVLLVTLPSVFLAGQVIAADDKLRALSPSNGERFTAPFPRPEFRVKLARVPGPRAGVSYQVFLRASRSKRLHAGLIGKGAFIGAMQQVDPPSGNVFRLTPDAGREYRFRKYWLNRRGRYYWQAYYIQCVAGARCIHPGPRRVIHIGN